MHRMGRTSDAKERILAAATALLWQQSLGTVSVDAICEAAAVKKGSFYYFFASKDDLVIAALDAHWKQRKPTLDALFAKSRPPLERLRGYFLAVIQRQRDLKKLYGRYVGCFYCAVGMDNSSPVVRRRVQQIFGYYTRYYSEALTEARDQGLLHVPNIKRTAEALFAYMEGVLTQARIRNDARLISNLADSAFEFLGIDAKLVGISKSTHFSKTEARA
jgi:TetR/AcrR family transcriptional repressor of nem operon